MFLSAVSLALIMGLSYPGEQAKETEAAWKAVAPSVIRLKEGFSTVGSAVMIDPSGYYLAHKSRATVGLLSGVTPGGITFPLVRVSTDDATGLVLLQASMFRDPKARPVRTAVSSPPAGTPVIVVMANGYEAGEISNPNRTGVLPQSKRLVFLTEVKLENPTPNLGGAPVFTYSGEFVGLLNANLQSNSLQIQSAPNPFGGVAKSLTTRGGIGGGMAAHQADQSQNYGPSSLFVAYAIGPELLQRVISGFLSPNHNVAHPFIGLYVRDTPRGAEVQAINPNSPAAASELRPGDLILSVGGTSISNRLDYARSLIHIKVGDRIKIVYLRSGHETSTELTIGRMLD